MAQLYAERRGFGRRALETPQGIFLIDPLSAMGNALVNGDFEPQMVETFHRFVSNDSTVVDLGANEGFFTIVGARLCPAGRVIAVEPQPECAAIVKKNVELNGCTNVAIWQGAVMDKEGTVDLFVHPQTNSGATSIEKVGRLAFRSLHVRCLTLTRLFEEQSVQTADLLKMDIEGAEYEAILGSPELFEQGRVRALALEYHLEALQRRSKPAGDIDRMLTNCGMKRLSDSAHAVYVRS